MSQLVSLHRTLSDAEFRQLRADVLRAEGVSWLTSADQSLLLRLACAELAADLDRAAVAVARLSVCLPSKVVADLEADEVACEILRTTTHNSLKRDCKLKENRSD
ncbi:unnamed protein product [Urochloa humidicola]